MNLNVIKHCFICHPSDFPVSQDPEIEPRIVVTLALTVKVTTVKTLNVKRALLDLHRNE
jgi:hypothetical protein